MTVTGQLKASTVLPLDLIDRFLWQELRWTLARRLGLVALFQAGLCFGAAYSTGTRNQTFALQWLILWLPVLVALRLTLKVASLRAIFSLGAVLSSLAICWSIILGLSGICSIQVSVLVACASLASSALLPLPTNYISLSTGTVALGLLLAVFMHALPAWNFILILTVLGFVIKTSAHTYLANLGSVAAYFFSRVIVDRTHDDTTVAFTHQLHWTIGGHQSLLLANGHKCRRLDRTSLTEVEGDLSYLQALFQRLKEFNRDEGMVSSQELGEQFWGPLTDWFGAIPRYLYYFQFRLLEEGQEKEVTVVTPATTLTILTGLSRPLVYLSTIASLVRLLQAVQRGKSLSSDVIISSERSLSEQEIDLNRVIHHVNNTAQDLSIISEKIKQQVGLEFCAEPKKGEALLSQIESIEVLARTLAAGVSDVKLLREIFKGSGVKARTHPVEPIVEEVSSFAKQRAYRRGERFEAGMDLNGVTGVVASGRELLETVLRLLCRVASSHLSPGGLTRFEVSIAQEQIRFSLRHDGSPYTADVKRRVKDGVDRTSGIIEVDYLKAALIFARLSGGDFEIGGPDDRQLVLSLPQGELEPRTSPDLTGWALLVDDNAEVTTFYARVAEALNLKFGTAASVDQATALIGERGQPRIVITDIQLGNSNGLDLVKTLRIQFGKSVPIIVVSGNNEEAIEDKVRDSGASKYLTKPVSRKRLFEEINSLLG